MADQWEKFQNTLNDGQLDLSLNKWGVHSRHTALKALLLVATGVFAGYTIQPMPTSFKNNFINNPLLKWLNLFIVGILLSDFANDKITYKEIVVSALVSGLLIVLFEWMRYYGDETSGNWVSKNVFPAGNRQLLQ